MSENTENQTTAEVGNQTQISQSDVELTTKVADYEAVCKSNGERIAQLENELKAKDSDASALKTRIADLEKEVLEAQKFKQQHLKDAEEVELLKVKSEDTLTRAKGIIFDKTKVIKNQELQIEALNQQISSLKDVVSITKDLLEIRNLEVKQLESKISCMDEKVAAEKERQDLMHKKLETMIRHNGELKREYETQLCLFSALRERYSERELAKGVIGELRANRAPTPAAANTSTSNTETSATTSNTEASPNTSNAEASTNTSSNTEASANTTNTEASAKATDTEIGKTEASANTTNTNTSVNPTTDANASNGDAIAGEKKE